MWKLRPEKGRGLPKAIQQASGKAEAGTWGLWEPSEQNPTASGFALQPPRLLASTPLFPTPPHPTPDEFGNRFEVNNCSICYHWVTAEPQEPVVFSADYKGCHVLEKVETTHCPGKEPHGQVPAWPNAVSGWGGLSWTRDTRAELPGSLGG